MKPTDFKSWRLGLGLTQAQAGEALGGYTARCILYWEKGEREMPLCLELACKWIENSPRRGEK